MIKEMKCVVVAAIAFILPTMCASGGMTVTYGDYSVDTSKDGVLYRHSVRTTPNDSATYNRYKISIPSGLYVTVCLKEYTPSLQYCKARLSTYFNGNERTLAIATNPTFDTEIDGMTIELRAKILDSDYSIGGGFGKMWAQYDYALAFSYRCNSARTITLNGNGATSGGTKAQYCSAGSERIVTLTRNSELNNFARTGYVFAGWATSSSRANAGTVDYYDGGNITLDSNITLWAVWKVDSRPNLVFSTSLPSTKQWTQAVFLGSSSSASSKAVEFTVGEPIYLYCGYQNGGSASTGKNFSILHQVLNASSECVCEYQSEVVEKKAAAGGVWNGVKLSILQGLSAGSYSYKCTLDSDKVISESNENDNTASYRFTVKPVVRSVSVTWDANEGWFDAGDLTSTGKYEAAKTFGSLPEPTRSGYSFEGWFTQKSGGKQIFATTVVSSVVSSSATTARFYAQWTKLPDKKSNLAFVCAGVAESWPQAVFLSCSASNAVLATAFEYGAPIYLYNYHSNNGTVETESGYRLLQEIVDVSTSSIVRSQFEDVSEFVVGGGRFFKGRTLALFKDLPAGRYVYRCTLDSLDAVAESNEEDNVATYAFTVLEDPGVFTVTYRPGSRGYEEVVTKTKTKGVPLVLEGALFTTKHFVQAGWTTVDGGERIYDLNALYGDDASITLYPYWEDENTKPIIVPVAQELSLQPGWNWISVSVATTDASFETVFKGVTFADEDVIKSSDGSATYYSGKWYPSPSTFKLVPGRAYAVKKSTDGTATVTVSGTAAPTMLAVEKGWNWIGPTASAAVALKNLKHSAGFMDEDVINSSTGSATYYGGEWFGSLESLTPGVGYKAKFGKAGTLQW